MFYIHTSYKCIFYGLWAYHLDGNCDFPSVGFLMIYRGTAASRICENTALLKSIGVSTYSNFWEAEWIVFRCVNIAQTDFLHPGSTSNDISAIVLHRRTIKIRNKLRWF